jgi:hypothetical protein
MTFFARKDNKVVFGFYMAVHITGAILSSEDVAAFRARHFLALFLAGTVGCRFHTAVMRDITTVASLIPSIWF